MLRTILLVVSLIVAAQSSVQAVEIGDTVLALWAPDNVYFMGTAVEQTDGGYRIVFEDGDTAVVAEDDIRSNDLEIGSKVFARWSDGRYYPAKIAKAVGRAFYIHYDDGEKAWASFSRIMVKE